MNPGCENIVTTVPLESPAAATACPDKATTNPAIRTTPPTTDEVREARAGIPVAERTSLKRRRQRSFVNAQRLSPFTCRLDIVSRHPTSELRGRTEPRQRR